MLREPQALLPDFQFLQDASVGDSEICIAVLDRSINLSRPCFRGADLRRATTSVNDPAGSGRIPIHGMHVASAIFVNCSIPKERG